MAERDDTTRAGAILPALLLVVPLLAVYARTAGFEFANEVVGGNIPHQFIPSCEKGIRATLETGVFAGYPMVDVKATVYDGKHHPVDSKDIAFQIAGRNAFKEAIHRNAYALRQTIAKNL